MTVSSNLLANPMGLVNDRRYFLKAIRGGLGCYPWRHETACNHNLDEIRALLNQQSRGTSQTVHAIRFSIKKEAMPTGYGEGSST